MERGQVLKEVQVGDEVDVGLGSGCGVDLAQGVNAQRSSKRGAEEPALSVAEGDCLPASAYVLVLPLYGT